MWNRVFKIGWAHVAPSHNSGHTLSFSDNHRVVIIKIPPVCHTYRPTIGGKKRLDIKKGEEVFFDFFFHFRARDMQILH